MQLGTRWTSGDQPPAAVPAVLHEQIRAVDAALPADSLGQPAPRWTLRRRRLAVPRATRLA